MRRAVVADETYPASASLTIDTISRMLQRLRRSSFRRRFRLASVEQAWLHEHDGATLIDHAYGIIRRRLAPATPPNDGKQTPMRGHPVFVAQHATATCCRKCLARWHRIPQGAALTESQIDHVTGVILTWIETQRRSESDSGTASAACSGENQEGGQQLRLF